MYTKKILSAAAAVAVMSTGAMAFDTNSSGGLLKENGDNTITIGTYTNLVTATNNPGAARQVGVDINTTSGAPYVNTGKGTFNGTHYTIAVGNPAKNLGDALIFPAFFSTNGWQSEFTVVNTSANAVVAKVVLYSYEDSKELKDFNIYLSANDVFRAFIKDGKITSTDDSTVVSATTSGTAATGFTDTAVMASADTPFETDLGEGTGYIAVYSMIEVNGTTTAGQFEGARYSGNGGLAPLSVPQRLTDGYDKQHSVLWADYRRLLDQCRPNWRGNLTGGIYAETSAAGQVNTPHVDMNLSNACNQIVSTRDIDGNAVSDANVSFRAPTETLSGSILVGTDDAAGSRNMLLPATPILGFSDLNSTVIWTEGEFASMADRCIDVNNTDWNGTVTNNAEFNNYIGYNARCVELDMNQTNTLGALYEFSNKENSALLITQPLKRTRIQLAAPTAGTVDGWRGITRDATSKLVTFYGGFRLNMNIYDDSENVFVNSGAGFIVSPATTASSTIPNEMSMMTNILDASPYDAGWARVQFTRDRAAGIPGIVTQMSASKIGDNPETNWIYPFVRSAAGVASTNILNARP